MSKVVGLMCVKDEADLLPQVVPHIEPLVDHLYAYDDGSSDDTWDYIKHADYAIRKPDDKARIDHPHNRANYHHLLEKIKEDFKGEDVWVVITMGDRFFLNQTPREIVARAGEYEAVEGIQLDFLRHRLDPWTKENDPFPDMSNIRQLCRWYKFDERCIVAYKLHVGLNYQKSKYPWPGGVRSKQYAPRDMGHRISLDMPFLEHQGRRTPNHCVWKYASGSRRISRKYDPADYANFESIMENQKEFYEQYRLFPWTDGSNLIKLVEHFNEENWQPKPNRRYFFWGMEEMAKTNPLPPRDLQ
jgi:hypothetical protein